jgi:phosphate-selective porin OprO/OprP
MNRWAAMVVSLLVAAVPTLADAADPLSRLTQTMEVPAAPAPPTTPAMPADPTPSAVPAVPVTEAPPSSNPLVERLKPTFELRGRIEADAVMVAQSTSSKALIGDIQNGYGFRRARIGAQGNIGTSARWVAEIDFANGNFRARDLYVALTALPGLRELRVGFFREPFSLEGATSSRFITFLERSPMNVLDPARNWGVAGSWWPENERATFAIGAFRSDTNSSGFSGGDAGNWAVTMRLTGLPVYVDEEGVFRLVHVGGAFSQRVPPNGFVVYAPAAQTNIIDVSDSPASPFLPKVNIPANSQQLYNLQAAMVYGPFSLQGEWFGTGIQQTGGGGPIFFNGFYAYASYFLTGEHRGYDRKGGAFSQVEVQRPLVRTLSRPASGCGAFELTARFSVADFRSNNLPPPSSGPFALAPQGAILLQTTFGMNWYLNDYTRVMFNYLIETPEARGLPALPVHVFGIRTAIFW